MATERAARPEPSTSQSAQPAAQPKRRSPVERAIVWIVILVLVCVVAVEARARLGYSRSLDQFHENVLGKQPHLSELRESSIHFWPSESREQREGRDVIILKWFSFLHDYRIALFVPSLDEEDPVVSRFETPGENGSIFEKQVGPPPAGADEPEAGEMMAGPPGGLGGMEGSAPAGGHSPAGGHAAPGGPGAGASGGGQRQQRTFEERDADGDGRLAGDELSERMQENLADLDKNGDGAIDQEEFEAMRAQFRARRQAAGGAAGDAPAQPGEAGDAPAAGENAPAEAERPAEAAEASSANP